MTAGSTAGEGLRISLLLPTPRDTRLTARLLAESGIATRACQGVRDLQADAVLNTGAVMVGEEWLAMGALDALHEVVAAQPPWSDLPILVVSRVGLESDHIDRVLAQLGNATLLDRPLRIAALTSAARAALRARQRQYQIRAQLEALESASRELSTAARRKDEFLAMLGHELRNPLAPILNALNMLRRRERMDPTERRLLETMQRQTDHMVRLVEDLVDVARLTRGTIELRREPVAVDEVVASAVELSRPLIEAAGHGIHLDVQAPGLRIEADRVRMTQVFSNLLNNATKYSSRNGRIDVRIRAEAGDAVVEVSDRGVGIQADVLPHVFDMFVQGNHDTQQVNEGLGIGLSLVRRLVEQHGGSVDARSDGPGHGSTFVVRLPLAAAAALAPPRPADMPPAADEAQDAARHLRVLVVDDNRDSAETLGVLLQTMGIDNRVAFSGEDALAAVAEAAPNAIFLDIGMPGMDGYEVARRIRARPDGARIRLVALTGWSQASDQARTRAAGFDFHMSKPADFDELERILALLSSEAQAAANDPQPTVPRAAAQ
jgi:signal transduction histidine kinase/ActR/RegA family two-component response regulator